MRARASTSWYRKFKSPVLSAAKAVNLTTALVSIFSLETAMVNRFAEEDDLRFREWMTAATALAVCMLVLAIAVFMVVQSGRKLKKLQNT